MPLLGGSRGGRLGDVPAALRPATASPSEPGSGRSFGSPGFPEPKPLWSTEEMIWTRSPVGPPPFSTFHTRVFKPSTKPEVMSNSKGTWNGLSGVPGTKFCSPVSIPLKMTSLIPSSPNT